LSPVTRRPRWIVRTVLVLAAVVVMVELGFWQLRRLHTVREDNAHVREHLREPVADIATVLAPGLATEDAVYRRVRVRGHYDRLSEILLSNRSFEGEPGSHVLTPLRFEDGRAVIVDRGWIPQNLSGPAREKARPSVSVDIDVVGVLFPS